MTETVQDFFANLPSRADASKTAGMTNSYVFDIEGAGQWKVDVDDGAVAPGAPVAQPRGGIDDRLSGLADSGELRGDRGEALMVRDNGTRLVAAGVGKREDVDRDALRTAGAAAAHQLVRVGGTLAWRLDDSLPLPLAEQAAALVEGTVIGGYTPGRWKTKEDGRPKPIERII